MWTFVSICAKTLNNGTTFRDTLNNLETASCGIKWSSPLADELHKPVRKHFTERYLFVRNVDDVYGTDLVDMQGVSRQNKGYKYILMVEDVFSKYGWAVPLKTKTGVAVCIRSTTTRPSLDCPWCWYRRQRRNALQN